MQQQTRQNHYIEDLLLRGVTWAMVGVIFGTLFVLLVEITREHLPLTLALFAAITGSSALTSLFYGSMRLTVLVANFTFIAMLIYTWQGAPRLGLEPLVLVGAGVGLAVGLAYGLHDKKSRVYCADAKIVAGIFAGSLGALVAILARFVDTELAYSSLAIVAAPVAILVYVSSAHWFIKRCNKLLPVAGDGAIVGLGVGTITGLVFLIMAATLDANLLVVEDLQGFVDRVEGTWAITVTGCAMACFPIGVFRSLFKVPWYNL